MKTLSSRIVLVCLAVLLFAGASYSQTQINGAASGNWSSTASWSPATVPNNSGPNTYNVTLLSSPAVNITLDISPTIDSLTLDSGSILSTDAGTTLTTTSVTNGGDIELYNGNTLTVNGSMTNSLYFDLDKGSKLVVTGNLTNSGQFYTDVENFNSAANTVTVDGTLTNSSGATARIGYFNDTSDVMNVGTLVNNGILEIDNGATLNLTSQPNGIIDIVAGSQLFDYGTIKAASANGLAKLGSIEGLLVVGTGQTFTDTPGSGTLTISNTGELDLENFDVTGGVGTNMTVSGNLTNSGQLYTNVQNRTQSGGPNTLTVTGTFTNSSGATTHIGYFGDTSDVMNVATLVNNGILEIDNGATLNLTAQPNGITDIVAGSQLFDYGTIKAGSANGLAKLGSIEGLLVVGTGQTFTDTPGSGTLTISSSGEMDPENFDVTGGVGTNMTVSGNLTNSGQLYTNVQNRTQSGGPNTLTVTGTFTNSSGATTHIGFFGDTTDVMNVATLANSGVLEVDEGATLNLTAQPNGVTDVLGGSQLILYGTLNAGSANGLAKLNSIEGILVVGNGQTFMDTPASGTMTISGTGEMDLENFDNGASSVGTNMTVSGNLTVNAGGQLYTNVQNRTEGKTNTLTVSGAFTNSGTTHIGFFGDTSDVMNVATLINNGILQIDPGATLNMTSQPNGVTDVLGGSQLFVYGTLNAGATNGLAKLGSIEGLLVVGNGQTTTITPAGGTLTISGTNSELDVENFIGTPTAGTNVTISGNLTNSGQVYTNIENRTEGKTNALTVTGTFTNNASGTTHIGFFGDTTDVMNVGALSNAGNLTIGAGATFNVTNPGTATNTGTIDVGDTVGGGTFKINGNTTLTGTTGKVILSNFAGNVIGGTGTLTNVKNTISGSGNIGNGTMGLNNQGTIDADQSTPLIIQAAGTASNSLTEEATLGATLQLDAGNYTQTAAGNILATETGNALSEVNLESGVSITGGKLTITGTTATINLVGTNPTLSLSGVTISGTGKLVLPDGSTTTLLGTNTNTSTIDLNSTGDVTTLKIGATTVNLNGTGKLILATNGDDIITGTSGQTLHTANTIEGPGNIGDGVIGIVNTGTIESVAHQTGQTEIDAGSAGFSNQGTVEAVASTTVYIDNVSNQFLNYNSGTLTGGTYIVDGILKFDGAAITTDAANITLSGAAAKIENGSGGNAITNLATIATGGTFDIITQSFTTTGNFTNNGTLDVGSGAKFIVLAADTLTNYNSGTMTLTGGAYNVTGTLEFAGANIVNNDASITLTGTKALIENSTNSANALAGFANNEAGATFALATAAKFTTAGNFTNSGTLNVGTGSLFAVGASGADQLTNFSSATSTLTGGTYIVTGTGQIQFNNGGGSASIVTNAANITLATAGSTASFIDQTGANMLANFSTNASTGSFTLESNRSFTTAGAFSNAGSVLINKGSTFTVGANGAYTNSAGSTTVNGTLTVTSSGAVDITGGTLFGDAGTINGSVSITGASLVAPGDAMGAIGDIKVADNYTQASSASLDIDLGGTAPNTLYDVLDITDAASLNGTLNVDLVNLYAPKVNASFTILNYGSDPTMSEFSTYNLPTVAGDHWTITYNAKDLVIKLVAGSGSNVVINNFVSGSAASPNTGTVTATPARRVSRASLENTSTSNMHEPVAILSRVTCFATRLIGSGSCGEAATSTSARGGETALHATSSASSTVSAASHNNVMVATRSIAASRGGASHETSASATAMARLYICAYLPSMVGHTMGCN
jgi:hypothetical protein